MSIACIFVDGENLRHSLVELFKTEFQREDYLPKAADWTKFYDWLAQQINDSERLRTYWYVIQFLDFWPYKLPIEDREKLHRLLSTSGTITLPRLDENGVDIAMDEAVKQLREKKSRMKQRFEGWTTLQNGIQSNHRAVEFRRAGACRYDLFKSALGTEKAVDVKLATDLLELRNIYDVAIIVTGDQDYVPAVEIIKNSGKKVVSVTFLTRDGRVLPGGAWRLNMACDQRIQISYENLKQYMNL